MKRPKLTQLEMRIMEAFWKLGACSVREVQETFPSKKRPAYTTVQTVVYRLERKKVLRCVKRISNAKIFEAAVSQREARSRFVGEILNLFGGGVQALMSHLVETGDLTIEDLKAAEKTLRQAAGRATEE